MTVTQAANAATQPRGGYLPPAAFSVHAFDDGAILNSIESVKPYTTGLAVDYLTRFALGAAPEKAFGVSLGGAQLLMMIAAYRGDRQRLEREKERVLGLLENIRGIDREAAKAACMLTAYDGVAREGPDSPRFFERIEVNDATADNIVSMVNRSVAFFRSVGPIVQDGFDVSEACNEVITAGDGDLLTHDAMWDLKVSKYPPTKEHTLQIAIYYLMGLQTKRPEFLAVKSLGFFNPRLNKAYQIAVGDVPGHVWSDIGRRVIGYRTFIAPEPNPKRD